MGATLTTVNALTKEVYGPRIVDQLENETTLLKRIEKTSRGTESQVGGKYVTFPLKTRRNHGIGYRNELEQLQTPGQQGWTNVRVPLRYGYGRVHLSGQTIDLVDENYQAFSSAITEDMEGLKDDLLKDTNRILWGDGTGTLATIDTGAGPVNTVSVGTTAAAVNWLDVDMQIDILSSNGVTPKAANRKVTAINEATGDFTFDGAAATVVVGDIVVRAGNYGREPQGLTSLVRASGTLFNLDPAVEPLWKSTEDNTGGALSESKMLSMIDTIRGKGSRPTVIFTDMGSRRAYFNLLKTDRRFTGTKEFTGGFEGLAFTYEGEVPVVTDVDAPPGKMWFLNEDTFKVYRNKDWHWEEKGGSIWNWVKDYDAFEAMKKKYWEFATDRRNANGVMTGITPG
jgi:hypothetical protein